MQTNSKVSKPNSQISKQHFLRKATFFGASQIMRLTQGHWSCTPTYCPTAIVIATPMKNIFNSSFYQRVFFFFDNLLTEKLRV